MSRENKLCSRKSSFGLFLWWSRFQHLKIPQGTIWVPRRPGNTKRPLTYLDLTFGLTSRIFAARLVTFDLRFVFYAQNWYRNGTFWKWLFYNYFGPKFRSVHNVGWLNARQFVEYFDLCMLYSIMSLPHSLISWPRDFNLIEMCASEAHASQTNLAYPVSWQTAANGALGKRTYVHRASALFNKLSAHANASDDPTCSMFAPELLLNVGLNQQCNPENSRLY